MGMVIDNADLYTKVLRAWLKDNGLYGDFCINLLLWHGKTLSEFVVGLWQFKSRAQKKGLWSSFIFHRAPYCAGEVWYDCAAAWDAYVDRNFTIVN